MMIVEEMQVLPCASVVVEQIRLFGERPGQYIMSSFPNLEVGGGGGGYVVAYTNKPR